MNELCAWLEQSAPSVWIRESLSVFAFPGVLTLHTLAIAVLAGGSAAIDLRILGVARHLPLAPMTRFLPLLWSAFWASAATGVALVLAYPIKAFTNPLFYVKLISVGLAVGLLRRVGRAARQSEPASERGAASLRRLAALSLLFWTVAIVSGRLLAYTYTRLLTSMDY